MFRLKSIIILWIILIVALILRLYKLDNYSLWYDEAIVVLDEGGLDKLPPLTKLFDNNFLLNHHDYLVLYARGFVHYWQKLFEKSEFALRLSSVIFSLLSIYFLYKLGKEIFNVKIAHLAGFLLAISPFHLYYSQELRPYIAACFFTLVATYSLLQITKNNKKRYWFIYGISNILNIYFLYITLIVLFSFCIFLVINIKKYKHFLRPIILTHIIILFLLMPLFLNIYPNLKFILYHEIVHNFSEFPIWGGREINYRNLLFTLKNFSIGYNVDYYSFSGKFITAIYFFLFLIGFIKFYKKSEMQLFSICLFTPILVIFSISKIRMCYVDRYFFFTFPFYLLGVAGGLSRFNKSIVGIFIFSIVAFNFFGLKNYYLNYLPQDDLQHIAVTERQNIKGMAKIIGENYKKGDRIMHTYKLTVFPLKFYIRQKYNNPDLIREVDRGTVIFLNEREDLFTIDYKYLHPTAFLPEKESISAKEDLEKNNRLWLIFSSWSFKGLNDEFYKVVKKIKEKFNEEKLNKFEGAFLYLFKK